MTHKISKFFLFLCLLLAAWGTSGTVGWSVLAMFALSSFAFLSALWDKSGEPLLSRASWTENPFLLPGLILISVNLLQLLNPAVRVYEYCGYQTVQFLEHIGFLPSGIVRDWDLKDTFFALLQLSATWYVAMSAWKLLRSGGFARTFVKFFAVNGTLVALLGIIQELTLAKGIYWLIPTNSHFYSTFYLRNAAGDFIFVAFMCCISWWLSNFNRRSCAGLVLPSLCALVCCFSCLLTRSAGACGIFFISIAAIAFFSIFKFAERRFTKYAAISIVCVLAALASSLGFVAAKSHSGDILDSKINSAYKSFKPRVGLTKLSWEIFKSSPVLGVGAGAYGVEAEIVSPQQKYFGQSKAFVNSAHNDLFEYACEYGLLGIASIALCLAFWIRNLCKRNWCAHNTVFLWTCLMLMLHSLVDMPLHIPATMFAFVFAMSLAAANFRKVAN